MYEVGAVPRECAREKEEALRRAMPPVKTAASRPDPKSSGRHNKAAAVLPFPTPAKLGWCVVVRCCRDSRFLLAKSAVAGCWQGLNQDETRTPDSAPPAHRCPVCGHIQPAQ